MNGRDDGPGRTPMWRRYARFWRTDVERDVSEELQFHLEERAREYERRGLSPDAARQAARERFGDMHRVADWLENHDRRRERRRHRSEAMSDVLQDVRYALRALRRSPAFSIVAVLTLAIGIAANGAIFGAVNAVLLRPLPYANADRLAVLWNSYQQPKLDRAALSPAEFADIRERHRGFAAVAALSDYSVNLTGGGEPARLQGYLVSPNFFDVLGIVPAIGRGFRPEEGLPGGPRAVVLSDQLWRSRFAADRSIVGRTLRFDDSLYTVVGVAPPGIRFPDAPSFQFPAKAELWFPHAWEQQRGAPRGNQYLRLIGLLKPDVTLAQAREETSRLAAQFRTEHPQQYRADYGWQPVLVSMHEQIVGDTRPALLILLAAVGLVLLIACANIANLLLSRTLARRPELAVRIALGAGRGRLTRQLLTESMVLAILGGTLGMLLAALGVRLIARFGPADVPRLADAHADMRVVLFTFAVTVVIGALCGLAPVMQQRDLRVHDVIRAGGRGVAGGRQRLSRALVTGQVALAVVVLVVSALLLQSLTRLQRVDPGIRADGLLTARLTLPESRYDSIAHVHRFYTALFEKLEAIPGVEVAGASTNLPFSGDIWDGSFVVEGRPVGPGEAFPHAEFSAATPGYFDAMGIALRSGRVFSEQDVQGAPRVVVVNEAMARQYWPGRDPAGARIDLDPGPDSVWATVVGVVAHVRRTSLAEDDSKPQIYRPFYQRPALSASVVVRATDPVRLAPMLRAAVREVDPQQPVAAITPMADLLAQATARERFNTTLLGAFAATALLLAAVGLYAVMSYLVAQRRQELGVRLALGARPRQVVALVVGQGARVAIAGVAIGLAAAAAISGTVSGLLYGVAAVDLATYAGSALFLTAIMLLASWLPARHAAAVDPISALHRG